MKTALVVFLPRCLDQSLCLARVPTNGHSGTPLKRSRLNDSTKVLSVVLPAREKLILHRWIQLGHIELLSGTILILAMRARMGAFSGAGGSGAADQLGQHVGCMTENCLG